MSIIYLDAGALPKVYIQKDRSDAVRMLVTEARGTATSMLTYTEMVAAMARANACAS